MLGVHTKPATARVPGREAGRADQYPHPVEWEDGQLRSDEWLATLSHELRNPLATILLALEAIAGGHELDPGARRARDVAERQARRALQLIEDLFDVCAGPWGKLPLRREVVDLAAV